MIKASSVTIYRALDYYSTASVSFFFVLTHVLLSEPILSILDDEMTRSSEVNHQISNLTTMWF